MEPSAVKSPMMDVLCIMNPSSLVAFMRCNFNLISSVKYITKTFINSHNPKFPKSEFSKILLRVRKERGLTQSQAGDAVGVCLATWLHWEKEQFLPPPSPTTAKLVEFLGFNPMPQATLAERLFALRFEKGWSLHEAAKTIMAGKLTWKKWEANQPVVLGRTSNLAREFLAAFEYEHIKKDAPRCAQ